MSLVQPIDEKLPSTPTLQPPSYQNTTILNDVRPAIHHRRPLRRLFHFSLAVLFIWVTARHILRHCENRRFGPPYIDSLHWGPDFSLGIPRTHPGESIDSCLESADWTEIDPPEVLESHEFPMWQKSELSLPIDAEDIFLLSRGFHAFGHLQIIEVSDRDDIGVEVIVGYHDVGDIFERSSLCTLRRGDDGHGVGIFTPRFDHRHHKRDRLFFNITLSLPGGKDVATLSNFDTHLPFFSQFVAKLSTYTFGTVRLHSTNSPIFADNLVAKNIRIRSRNGPIDGTFNTSSSLDIETSNSPIKVVVNAFNENNSVPTSAKIRTRNGFLSADLSLVSTFENGTSGAFSIVTRTSNSPLDVKFSAHAPDGLLKLDARTSNSPAKVQLHPAFEGTLKLRTSLFAASVDPDLEADDPAGRDRTRNINVSSIGRHSGIVHADVAWLPEDDELKPDGEVKVCTSNSPLEVQL